jgi:hypothetical protein
MICFNKECSKDFNPKTHNQKYCSDQCCRVATNKRIMEKYYEKKAIKKGALRKCKKCTSDLSRYNQKDICVSCEKSIDYESKKMIWSIISDIS